MENKNNYLKEKCLLCVSQHRFSSPDKIPGKSFYEARYWSKYFKLVFFVGHSDTGKYLYKREGSRRIKARDSLA